MTTSARRSRWVPRLAAGAVLTVATSLLVVGVVGRTPSASAAGLSPFDGCDDLGDWYRGMAEPLVTGWGLSGPVLAIEGRAETMAAAPGPAGTEAGAVAGADASAPVGPGATGTNLQEAGVDEPDIVKTDGRLLFTTVGADLVVVDVSGAEPRQVGSVPIPLMGWGAGGGWGGWGGTIGWDTGAPEVAPDVKPGTEPGVEPGPAPDVASGVIAPDPGPAVPGAGTAELLLVGDRVVVLGTSWYDPSHPSGAVEDDQTRIAPVPPTAATTTATVVDVSDPTTPTVVASTELEGGYVSARESGGAVRLVVSSTPVLPFVTSTSADVGPDGQVRDQAALEANRGVLAAASGQDFVPHLVSRDAEGTVTGREPAMACAAVSHPADPAGIGTVTVLTLDIDAAAADSDPVVDAVAVSADGDLVYASQDRLYVATTTGGWSGVQAATDVRTALHGFDVTDPARTGYLASGEVEGYLLGRWALSARDGFLRVATTRGDVWGAEGGGSSDSAVTVLAEQGGALTAVGQVAGLGVGEQVRAVRWFEDTAVVVTFRQTDPLYVVDLADPTAPLLAGELKIPGYSAYLHPIGDGMLLGVGQDATDTGQTTGVQLSSFDLSDPSDPTRVDAMTEANAYSDVEGDARLFTYLPHRRVALLPVSGPAGSSLRAVHVDEGGALQEVGAFTAVAPQQSWDSWSWVQRAVPVDGDRVAVLVQRDAGPQLTVLTLDELGVTGTTALAGG